MWIFYIVFVAFLVVHPIWFTYMFVVYFIERKRLKEQSEIDVADVVTDTEKTGLLDGIRI